MYSDNVTLDQFNLLMHELLAGHLDHRSKFHPWEIDLLLDIDRCHLAGPAKRQAILDYQSATQLELETGAARPRLLSEFLNAAAPVEA